MRVQPTLICDSYQGGCIYSILGDKERYELTSGFEREPVQPDYFSQRGI